MFLLMVRELTHTQPRAEARLLRFLYRNYSAFHSQYNYEHRTIPNHLSIANYLQFCAAKNSG